MTFQQCRMTLFSMLVQNVNGFVIVYILLKVRLVIFEILVTRDSVVINICKISLQREHATKIIKQKGSSAMVSV